MKKKKKKKKKNEGSTRKAERIKKRIASLKNQIESLERELHDEFSRDAIRTVESWRPDLRLMLGPPPRRVSK